MNYEQANAVKELAPKVNGVLEGLEWVEYLKKEKGGIACQYHWQPKIGEFFLTPDNEIRCIGDEVVLENMPIIIDLNDKNIPILEWEEIEGLLQKAGYSIRLSDFGMAKDYNYRFEIWGDNGLQIQGHGKSRQEAVMKAVIQLGKDQERPGSKIGHCERRVKRLTDSV